MRIFSDTSALLALGNPGEDRHTAAAGFFREAAASTRFVVSDYVLDEALTRWITSGRASRGLAFVDALLESPRYELVFVGQPIFDRARQKAGKFAAHRLSFTDCTTVVLVETLRLDGVFAFDEGFARVGLRMFPGP